MATAIILLQLAIVLALIFIGARVGGIGRFVINHSFQIADFTTTIVSIGIGYLIIQFL